jgi:hypothetical protein
MQFYQATVDSSRGRDLQCSSDPRSGLRAAFPCGYARSLLDWNRKRNITNGLSAIGKSTSGLPVIPEFLGAYRRRHQWRSA